MKFIGFNDGDIVFYLLSIAAGILTFSIPLVWNFYKSIIDLQEKTIGDSSEHILTKYVYRDRYNKFEWYVLIPTAVLAFLSLFIAPFYGFVPGYICLGVMFLYAFWLPWIFGEVKRRSSKNLKELILSNQLIFEDYRKILHELWGKYDREIKEDALLRLEATDLFKSLAFKIDEIFIKDLKGLKKTFILLDDFNSFLIKRTIFFLTVRSDVLEKILVWHFKSWEEEYFCLNQKEELDFFGAYSEISGKLDDIIIGVMKRTLSDGHTYNFFAYLEKHVSLYKEIEIEGHTYLDSIPIYNELFENVENSREAYSLWGHYFPKEWKITKENLKKDKIARVWFKKFFTWANHRIGSGSIEFDKALDGVVRGLFPEVNPIRWSLIMAYFSISWGNSRMESLIEWKKNFGFSSNIFVSQGEDENESKFEEYLKEVDEKTYELAAFLFGNWLKNTIDNNIIKLEKLKNKYTESPERENRRKEILEIFEGIKKYM